MLVPVIEVGSAGWCIRESGGGATGYSCAGDSVVEPIIDQSWSSGEGVWEGDAVTTSVVSAVSIDGGPSIRTYRALGLPGGWRTVAVEVRGFRKSGRRRRLRFTPLNAKGQRLRERLASFRLLVTGLPAQSVADSSPLAIGSCHIEQWAPLSGLSIERESTLIHVAPMSGLLNGALMPCASAIYHMEGTQVSVSVLVNAAHPGRTPVTLPAMQPLKGHAGVFQAPGVESEMAARRIPGGWLVVSGGAGLEQRVLILEHLWATI